jgi:hypothetical protein
MVKVTEEMRGMIEGQLAFVGTADRDGKPNVAPKGSMRLEDEETLVFSEGIGKKTLQNLRENPNVTVAYVDLEKIDGYQFKGKAEILEEGPLFDKSVKISEKRGKPKPKAAVKIKIAEIYSLKPGPRAGEKIA